MAVRFPSHEWLQLLCEKLNNDAHYGQVARNWEGDLLFDILAGGRLTDATTMYLDLWHGACRAVEFGSGTASDLHPKFVLRAPYETFSAILIGKMDAMTAMMSNRLKVVGNLGYMMRNVPTVLDFVRCAKEVTTEIL